ncbi:MAG: S8 family serine peptidase [Halobacteriovoraceae bacterium]|jgi:subtilisin family serine protease|nr:S8 family serine peptidase [Halobacteriovoraceae bacterium]
MMKKHSLLAISLVAAIATAQIAIAKPLASKVSNKLAPANNIAYPESELSTRFTSWGISPKYTKSSINLKDSWKKFTKKKDIIVAVVDTGIQYNHPFLKNNVYHINGKGNKANFGKDFSVKSAKNTPSDSHGHGTHVAGIIKSIFPDVKLLTLKYYNPKASGTANLNSTIKALKYAVDNNVDIINYSGGGPEASEAEKRVLKEAEKKGILIIAAAGNEKSNIDIKKNHYFPASYGLSNIITVGAHDEFNKVIASSNYGSKSVDIAAPGYRIKSSIPGNGAGLMTGTSQATAFVTGVAALIKSNFPKLNYQQVRNIILSSSKKISSLKGKVLGGGKLDAARAIEVANYVNQRLNPTPGRSVARK